MSAHHHFRGTSSHHEEAPVERRGMGGMSSAVKNHFTAAVGEFVGTFMFLLFAFGGTNAVNTAPHDGQPADLSADAARLLFISLCFGVSLLVNAWVFYRITGGMFNPAVTIGLMTVGAVGLVRGAVVIASQLLGGIAAAGVVSGLQPGGLYVSTMLSSNTSVVQGFFIEVFLTAQLVFTILMLAVEKHRGTFMAPLGIGLSLFITQMMGIYYTGGSVNPARSFGPAVVTRSFPSYHWIYFIGPILGALLASGFYKFIKALEYEGVNPGQDDDGFVVAGSARASTDGGASEFKGRGDGAAAPGSASARQGASYGGGPSMEAARHA